MANHQQSMRAVSLPAGRQAEAGIHQPTQCHLKTKIRTSNPGTMDVSNDVI